MPDESDGGGGGSFFDQVKRVANPATLVPGLAKATGQTVLAPLRWGYRAVTEDDHNPFSDITNRVGRVVDEDGNPTGEGQGVGSSVWQFVRDELPLVGDQGDSMVRTAKQLPYGTAAAVAAPYDWLGADGIADDIRANADYIPWVETRTADGDSRLDPRNWGDAPAESGSRIAEEYRRNPVINYMEDIGNVAIAGGVAARAVGGGTRTAAQAGARSARVLTNQADDIARKAASDIASLETGLEAARKTGNAARVAQIEDAIAAARKAADDQIAPLRQEAAAAQRIADDYAASTRGQITSRLDLVSGVANRLDPTNQIAYTGYRAAKAASTGTGRAILAAARRLPEGNAVRVAIEGAGDRLGSFIRSRAVRQNQATWRADSQRQQLAAELPINAALNDMVKALPDESSQTVAAIAAFGEADLFLEMPTVAKIIDEGGPDAQRYLDEVFYAKKAPSEQVPTVAQVKEAMDYRRGLLDPERAAALDAGVAAWRRTGELSDEAYLTGRGESVLPDPLELERRRVEDVEGAGPRASVVEDMTYRARRAADAADEKAARSADRAAEAAARFDERYMGAEPASSAQVGRHVADQGATAAELRSMSRVERAAMSRERTLATARRLSEDARDLRIEADALIEQALEPRRRTDAQAVRAGRAAERTAQRAATLRADADANLARADQLIDDAAAPGRRSDAAAVQAGRLDERTAQRVRELRSRADGIDAQIDQLVDDLITKEQGSGWKRVDNGRERAEYLRRKAELTEAFRTDPSAGAVTPGVVTDGQVRQAQQLRDRAARQQREADLTEAFAPDPADGALRPGNLTDRHIDRAQKMRAQADRLDRRAELVEAFAPDPASARGKAMDAMMRRAARDGAEMSAQLSRVEQLARQARKDAKAAATAHRRLNQIVERAERSVEAAPPRYQPLLFELRRLREAAAGELRAARLDYGKELLATNPELARTVAGNVQTLDAKAVAAGLKRAETRLEAGKTVKAELRGALDDFNHQHPELSVSRQIAAEAALGVQSLVDAGIDPVFATGGFVSTGDRLGVRPRATTGGTNPTLRKTAAENAKTAGVLPRTAEQAAQLRLREIRKGVQNDTARRIIHEYGTTLEQVIADGADPALADLRGAALREAMADQGLVALDSRPAATGDFILPDNAIGPNTVWVPDEVVRTFEKDWAEISSAEAVIGGNFDKATSAWKKMVLPLSPRWWVNNTVGNAYMLTMAGVRPWDAARILPEARRLLKEIKEGNGHVELLGAVEADQYAVNYVTRRNQLDATLSNNRAARTVQRAVRGSYAVNSYVDNMYRLTLYLERRKRGFSAEQAVRDAIKTFGDYSNMTRFERTWARRVFSFYGWTRTITKHALSLPIEHPVRTAWLATLSERYGQEELPGFLRGTMVGEDLLLPTGGQDPYGTITEGGITPEGLLGGVNPYISNAYAFASGHRLDGRDVYLPPGTDGGALATRLRVLGEDLWNMTPQTRAWHQRDGVRRYSDGSPRLDGGRLATRDRWDGPLGTLPYLAEDTLRILGVPYPKPVDLEAERRMDEQYQRQDEKARRRYEARRRAAERR